jgi:hypothetical protein
MGISRVLGDECVSFARSMCADVGEGSAIGWHVGARAANAIRRVTVTPTNGVRCTCGSTFRFAHGYRTALGCAARVPERGVYQAHRRHDAHCCPIQWQNIPGTGLCLHQYGCIVSLGLLLLLLLLPLPCRGFFLKKKPNLCTSSTFAAV